MDYAMSVLRTCFEGNYYWLGSGYRAGDERGCVGVWFSGRWYTQAAIDYINVVEGHLRDKPWLRSGF
jgi:autotransporter family porin